MRKVRLTLVCGSGDPSIRKRNRHIDINILLWCPVDPGTTGQLTGQKCLCVLLRNQKNKRFLLVNRLVVPGLTAFSKSLCVKSLCAFFLPDPLGSTEPFRGPNGGSIWETSENLQKPLKTSENPLKPSLSQRQISLSALLPLFIRPFKLSPKISRHFSPDRFAAAKAQFHGVFHSADISPSIFLTENSLFQPMQATS